ncbi:MAG: phage major tail tube protein [Lachnospiraceae bacterium]|nr:phage major tail tube protein [Lachnospiraceae bacterium]
MAGTNVIVPELVNNYNIYDDKAKRLIGVSGEIGLGELKAMTDTIQLAGMLGEYDAPATGHFSSMKLKIPFAIIFGNMFDLLDPSEAVHLTLRGSMQTIGQEDFKVDSYGVKIVVRGRMTSTALGKWARAKKGEPEIELELLYIKIMIDGEETLELDKLNFKYVIKGKDAMAKIRSQI